MKITIDSSLKTILCVGVMKLDDLQLPRDNGDSLWQHLTTVCMQIGECHAGINVGQVPGIQEARRLYRAIGLDPTKTRPSSEALLRRVLKGHQIYRIHPIVDIFNMVSLQTLLPVGLYDQSKISGIEITMQLGKPDWGYAGIRKDRVNVANRLCIVDDKGPFGSPTSDSLRTSIDGPVKSALAVFFLHHDGDLSRLESALDQAGTLVESQMSGHISERFILRS